MRIIQSSRYLLSVVVEEKILETLTVDSVDLTMAVSVQEGVLVAGRDLGAGDTVLHQEAGPTLQQCMSLCRAVAECGYIAWSQHLLGDTTCRLLRLALVRGCPYIT